MRLAYKGGSVDVLRDSIGRPEIVFPFDRHAPLAEPTYYRSTRLRVLRGGKSYAVASLFDLTQVINRAYWSGDTVVFKRLNGETAYELKVAGSD